MQPLLSQDTTTYENLKVFNPTADNIHEFNDNDTATCMTVCEIICNLPNQKKAVSFGIYTSTILLQLSWLGILVRFLPPGVPTWAMMALLVAKNGTIDRD